MRKIPASVVPKPGSSNVFAPGLARAALPVQAENRGEARELADPRHNDPDTVAVAAQYFRDPIGGLAFEPRHARQIQNYPLLPLIKRPTEIIREPSRAGRSQPSLDPHPDGGDGPVFDLNPVPVGIFSLETPPDARKPRILRHPERVPDQAREIGR